MSKQFKPGAIMLWLLVVCHGYCDVCFVFYLLVPDSRASLTTRLGFDSERVSYLYGDLTCNHLLAYFSVSMLAICILCR